MLMISLAALTLGALLGVRFKVLVIVPATMLVLVFVLAIGLARDHGGGWIVLSMIINATCLQAGYLGGLYFRHAGAVPRTVRMRKAFP